MLQACSSFSTLLNSGLNFSAVRSSLQELSFAAWQYLISH